MMGFCLSARVEALGGDVQELPPPALEAGGEDEHEKRQPPSFPLLLSSSEDNTEWEMSEDEDVDLVEVQPRPQSYEGIISVYRSLWTD